MKDAISRKELGGPKETMDFIPGSPIKNHKNMFYIKRELSLRTMLSQATERVHIPIHPYNEHIFRRANRSEVYKHNHL